MTRVNGPRGEQAVSDGATDGVLTVVVADDHALTRRGLAKALSRHPRLSVVGQAANGEEALELVARLEPDIVLMDIRMPVLDGLEATRRIRVRGSSPAVVLISSFDDAHFKIAAIDAGATAYIGKSASEGDLVDVVLAAAGRFTSP
jgi:DNA-binding NarL/FixJ family response regulator